jgi:phenylpyruvate tautomerase PptA (4-oxalocrotonate tautomerase family)
MPFMKLISPPLRAADAERLARDLTEAVVQLLQRPLGPYASAEELRRHSTIQFAPYQPGTITVGGEREHQLVVLEYSDWGLNLRRQRRLARELTPLIARFFDGQTDQVEIRFHHYQPSDRAIGGELLVDKIPWIGRMVKKLSP